MNKALSLSSKFFQTRTSAAQSMGPRKRENWVSNLVAGRIAQFNQGPGFSGPQNEGYKSLVKGYCEDKN